jgi:hypothetical protein
MSLPRNRRRLRQKHVINGTLWLVAIFLLAVILAIKF